MNINSYCAEVSVSNESLPRFLEVAEVAALLRCKQRTIYDMVEQERIPYRKVGVEDCCSMLMKSSSGPNESVRDLLLGRCDEYIAGRSSGCNRKGERTSISSFTGRCSCNER
ncbi:MAG: helix-turn-helix domain-containing protein [Acidobacteria bacterium]|nr:helix-turn-helix domain-containing protein [Acidobacteriota bacterium]